jgi:RecA/RadA recombinase
VLLFGPPGTGKTLLARSAAAACQAVFVAIDARSGQLNSSLKCRRIRLFAWHLFFDSAFSSLFFYLFFFCFFFLLFCFRFALLCFALLCFALLCFFFFVPVVSDLAGSFLGETEENLRLAFERAQKVAAQGACVLFIDEIDTLCPQRAQGAS